MAYDKTPNTTNYDGTKDKMFSWSSGFGGSTDVDLQLLRSQVTPAYNLFSSVLIQLKQFMSIYDTCLSLVQSIKAHGLDNYDNGPPYPLEGTLAALKASDLAAGLLVETLLIQFMNTPIDVNKGVGTPNMQTPDTILRRLIF